MITILEPITRLVVAVLIVRSVVGLEIIVPETFKFLPLHATRNIIVVILATLGLVHSSTHLTITKVLCVLDFNLPVIESISLVHLLDCFICFLRLREHNISESLLLIRVAVFDDVH